MFTLPVDASDDDLREGVSNWFCLVASGGDAQAFLDNRDPANSMSVADFVARVAELTGGGKVTTPGQIPEFTSVEDFAIDGPAPLVGRWLEGPETTRKYPECVADILYPIPVNGEWSDLDASFFVRSENGVLSLQLRDVMRLDD